MEANRQSHTFGRLGEGPTGLAKLCLIVGMCSIFIAALGSSAPDPAKDIIYWIQRAIVGGAIVILLAIFFKHPLPSQRPEGLTGVLIASAGLFLAAWVTGIWPGVFIAPLLPLLVAGSWCVERLRRG
ncbi:hypothetical protein AB0H94_04430 [Streptomyces purpurascens]|uniref:hypothetical protein n=1 Tax=Streptomyces purpurascens TaxID=1924 RepID=UPI0033CEC5A1